MIMAWIPLAEDTLSKLGFIVEEKKARKRKKGKREEKGGSVRNSI